MNLSFVLRRAARTDLSAALTFYAAAGGRSLSVSFAEAFEAAARLIGDHPSIGAPVQMQGAGVSGLRSQRLRRFPS